MIKYKWKVETWKETTSIENEKKIWAHLHLHWNQGFLQKGVLQSQIQGENTSGKQLLLVFGRRLNKVLHNIFKCLQLPSTVTHTAHKAVIGSGWLHKVALVSKLGLN